MICTSEGKWGEVRADVGGGVCGGVGWGQSQEEASQIRETLPPSWGPTF